MIILSNSIAQTIEPGQSATFDTIILKTGCSECFRNGSGAVILKKSPAIYEVEFGGNIGSDTVGSVQLSIGLNNSPMGETTMIYAVSAANDLNSVSRSTSVNTCGCGCETISIINNGTEAVTLGAKPLLRVKRTA